MEKVFIQVTKPGTKVNSNWGKLHILIFLLYTDFFFQSKRDGMGSFITLKGNQYIGTYWNGLMHGKGSYTFYTGDKYEGEFHEGKFEGKGVYTYANGVCKSGIFKNGKPLAK